MNDQHLIVTHADRCRLGALLDDVKARGLGESRWRAELEEHLEKAQRIGRRHAPDTLVTMNTRFVLDDLDTGESSTVTLVYPDEQDLASDGVSILDPLGTALIGCQVGDVVKCPDEQCRKRLRVSEIIYQPEQAGATHL